jgi:hypothetical protein
MLSSYPWLRIAAQHPCLTPHLIKVTQLHWLLCPFRVPLLRLASLPFSPHLKLEKQGIDSKGESWQTCCFASAHTAGAWCERVVCYSATFAKHFPLCALSLYCMPATATTAAAKDLFAFYHLWGVLVCKPCGYTILPLLFLTTSKSTTPTVRLMLLRILQYLLNHKISLWVILALWSC